MKKILFDLLALRVVDSSRYHGGSEYSKELLDELLQKKNDFEMWYLFDADLDQLDLRVRNEIDENRILIIKDIYEIPTLLIEHQFDKFVSGMPYRYRRLNFGDSPCVFTIHGLRRIELPYDDIELKYVKNIRYFASYIFRKHFTKLFVNIKRKHNSDLMNATSRMQLIVPSEHTKYSILVNTPGFDPGRVTVSYSPLVKDYIDESLPEVLSLGKYYLMVSTHRWGKNAYRAVKAFDRLVEDKRTDAKMVLLGMTGNRFKNFGVKHPERFIVEKYIERSKYESYLKEAYALVYPSLNEGFGYPPYEAMKYGTPVAMSAVCSLPEIYKNECLFFNPYDVNEIAVRILELENWDLKSKRAEYIRLEAQRILKDQKRMTDDLIQMIID